MSQTTDTAVIVAEKAVRDAYQLGRREGPSSLEVEYYDGPGTREHTPAYGMDAFRDTARYANIVTPEIRRLSGFGDPSGRGTHTAERRVGIIRLSNGEDSPGQHVSSPRAIYEILIDAFDNGWRDAPAEEPTGPDVNL